MRISINDLVIKAVGRAHRIMPAMDAIWTDDAIQRLGTTDVGIAINTERGLVTPVLRNVAGQALTDLAAAARNLTRRARAGELNQAELEGGSITVSNLGMFGVEEFSGPSGASTGRRGASPRDRHARDAVRRPPRP